MKRARWARCILLVIFFLHTFCMLAQKRQNKISLFEDSTQTFRRWEKYAAKRGVTYKVFKNIFTLPPPSKIYMGGVKKQNKNLYAGAEKKVIRRIVIVSLDPFGTDIADTTLRSVSLFEKGGNIVHVKTLSQAIKSRLLFKEGDLVDKLKLYESERIIRAADFVNDASIRIDTSYKSKDSVDIVIRSQDRWSIYPKVGLKNGNYMLGASERNLLGTGHLFDASFFKTDFRDTSPVNYRFNYAAPYLKNTFIAAGIVYNHEKGNEYAGISLARNFFSPLARWAGGVDVYNYKTTVFPNSNEMVLKEKFAAHYWTQDYWFGWAFAVGDTCKDNRRTKLVLAARFYNKSFQESAKPSHDVLFNYQNQSEYLFHVGIRQWFFYKDKYIYKFGVTEDVPMGAMINAVWGLQSLPTYQRYYLGIRSVWGSLYKGGNVAAYFEAGTYFTLNGRHEQGSLNTGLQGFGNVLRLPFGILCRQFASLDFTFGFNRRAAEYLTINNIKGLKGFESSLVKGTNRMVLSLSSVFYLPWQAFGFRIAPVLYMGFGMIGDEKSSFLRDNAYPVLGFGVQVRNEYLVFNTFLVSFAYYPYVPNVGNHLVKFNPYESINFQFRHFDIGKPSIVGF